MHERAGLLATPADLIDLEATLADYFRIIPDPRVPGQRVAFGTSGHRGTSRNGSFNEAHIIAMTAAIVEYRATQGITGPIFLGADTHPLSGPAERTAREVLSAAGVRVFSSKDGEFVPTPALSRAILAHNKHRGAGEPLADGIVVTPSHNPPGDGGFKYNPPHGGPADTDATSWIAARANDLLESGVWEVPRDAAPKSEEYDFLGEYVEDLGQVINLDAIRTAGVRIGAHPLGGASVAYWGAIAERWGLDLTVLGPGVDPQWGFMSLDWDGKIRMDPSSPNAMAAVIAARDEFQVVTGNDADADRHGIVTPDEGLMNPNHFLAVAIEYLLEHRPEWADGAAIG